MMVVIMMKILLAQLHAVDDGVWSWQRSDKPDMVVVVVTPVFKIFASRAACAVVATVVSVCTSVVPCPAPRYGTWLG
jgi:hypothetical protein